MRYEIAFQPSYSLAIVQLEPGEEIRAEAGAMVSMSADLTLEAKVNSAQGGGIFSALKKAVLTQESFFISTIKATSKAGEVTLAPSTPGDINALEVQKPLMLHAHSYLASTMNISVDSKFAGFNSFVGGEGLFFLRVTGTGTVFMTSFGALYKKTLQPGERYVVDTAHMVAFEEGVTMTTRMAANDGKAGFFKRAATSAATGEGLVMEFTGPGNVWIQSRNPGAFSAWVHELMPKASSASSEGGGLLGTVGKVFGG
ncbi:MAG: hypothetical protein JWM80_2896 [Cyanobacteria bacterium RYN_339]|nr:hypothetical protein [Cyanobacteria bacterium RYN_339]